MTRAWFALPPALALACWSPRDTGPSSMVGQLLDSTGSPLPGVQVHTVEARSVTDEEGRFGVSYKEPAQWVGFEHEGLRWRRSYLPTDAGRDVAIQLPDLHEQVFVCDMPLPCAATLLWRLDDGLRASLPLDCDQEPERQLRKRAPAGPPTSVTCRDDPASPDRPVAIRKWTGSTAENDVVHGMQVFPELVDMTLRLERADAHTARSCEVWAGGEPAQPVPPDPNAEPPGDARFRARVWGWVPVWAVCDGLIGPPQVWRMQQDAEVRVAWAPPQSSLDLRAHHPQVERVLLAKPARPGPGWVIELPRNPDGTWQLPPLRPGRYQLGLDAPEEEVLYKEFRPDMPPDVIFVEGTDIAERRGDGSLYGVLDLKGSLPSGPARVAWATEEYDFRPPPSVRTSQNPEP